MIKVNGYSGYNGGKSGSGTWQTLINHVPPHKFYVCGCLGNCGLTRHIKPAQNGWLNDIDFSVIENWRLSALPFGYELNSSPVIELLRDIEETWFIGNDTFIYLDPPYRMDSRKSKQKLYNFEMSDSQHIDLLEQAIKMTDYKIMISHYPNPVYDDYLSDWKTVDFLSKTRNGMAWERIYMNYELTGELHDYRFIGGNFRERERISRIKNNFMKKLDALSFQEQQLILTDFFQKYKV